MLIKVAATSRSLDVAGAISGVVRETGNVQLQAIGASAVNQAVKSISIAQDYLNVDDIEILTKIEMITIFIKQEKRTAVLLTVRNVAADEGPNLNE